MNEEDKRTENYGRTNSNQDFTSESPRCTRYLSNERASSSSFLSLSFSGMMLNIR